MQHGSWSSKGLWRSLRTFRGLYLGFSQGNLWQIEALLRVSYRKCSLYQKSAEIVVTDHCQQCKSNCLTQHSKPRDSYNLMIMMSV